MTGSLNVCKKSLFHLNNNYKYLSKTNKKAASIHNFKIFLNKLFFYTQVMYVINK